MRYAIGFVAAAIVGCGGEGGASMRAPVRDLPEAGVDALYDAAPSPQPDAQPKPDAQVAPKRTVIERDPFGSYARTTNLLLDGDFEWSGRFASTYPWLSISGSSAGFGIDTVVGAQCRSGVKCATLAPGKGIAGIGVSPSGDSVVVSAWAKPGIGADCSAVEISLSGCFVAFASETVMVHSSQADDDGWCRWEGAVGVPLDTPCLFVTLAKDAPAQVLIDDVVMDAPAGPSATLSLRKASSHHQRLVRDLQSRARELLGPRPPQHPEPPPALRGKLR